MFYFLIGNASENISGSTAPTLRHMLQKFLYYYSELKKSKKESAMLVVDNAIVSWNNLNIETRRRDKIEEKMIKEYDNWHDDLSKNKSKESDTQKQKRADFCSKLDEIFDATKKAPKRPAQFALLSSDPGVSKSKKRLLKSSKLTTEQSLRSRLSKPFTRGSSEVSSATTEEIAAVLSDSTPSDDNNESQMSFDPVFEQYYKRNEKKMAFINNHVVSTIDATEISDYKACRILTAVAQALGHDIDNLNVSRATIQRRRAENRKVIKNTLQKG